MVNTKLERSIAKMMEIRESRQARYGDGIFEKDFDYFVFMLKEKLDRLTNTLGVTQNLYETRLDTLIDIMTYAAIAYESQLDKSSELLDPEIKKIELIKNSETGLVSVFLDGKFVGNVNSKNLKNSGIIVNTKE
jgi:hypothetical protein